MKVAAIVSVIVAVVAIWLLSKTSGQNSSNKTTPTKSSDPKDVYLGLRNMALHSSRSKLGLAGPSKPTEPWGVLMDWGIHSGTATVFAMSDGSASVYLTSGGGYLGGIGQEPIRNAAKNAVEIARAVPLPAQPSLAYPLPEQHGVIFYFLTDAGVFVIRTSEEELNSPTHPLRKIGDAMQEIITQYRLRDEKGRPGGA